MDTELITNKESEDDQSTTKHVPEKNIKNEDDNDPFAYLNRDFSNEQFKIVLRNLPKYYGISEFKKLLNKKLNLNCRKIKQGQRNSNYCFVCFQNEEERDKGIQVLDGYSWKGKNIEVSIAKPSPDPFVKKRKEEQSDNQNKKLKIENIDPLQKVKESTIPLADVPYSDQLKLKETNIRNLLKDLTDKLYNASGKDIKSWIDEKKEKNDGLVCYMENIKYASKTDGYRNKCSFSFGLNEASEPKVGFRLSSYARGNIDVGPIDELRHIPEEMKLVCKQFEKFAKTASLQVFHAELQTGHYKQLTLRLASNNQLMLIIGINPQNLDESTLSDFKKSLVEFFSEGEGKVANVTSLYYEMIIKKKSEHDYTPPEHLWGKTHNFEEILGLTFKISPEAFFQINTEGAQILYQSAIDLVLPCEKSTILDVCCGTGTIGLCFAKYCSQVLGIEIISKAIADAKENALLNNIKNCSFYTGKAEEMLGNLCYQATGDEIIAILDPPRAGLHQKAIVMLRKIRKIKKLIYLSCNSEAALRNFLDLGRPVSKTLTGDPFMPIKAIPVDLFPHTKHCELIILFERIKLNSDVKLNEDIETQ